MACPTFQIHHRGPGSSPPGQDPPPPPHRGWDSASLPPLDLWQFLLPAADWYPATIQHFEWCVNLRGEHTLTSGLRGVLFPPARLSSEDPDFNIRPPTPRPALAATLDFPQTFLRGLSAHVQSPPGVGDTWDHTAGVRGVTRPPGLPWAVSTGLEGSRRLGECPLTRDCRRGGDTGFLASFNGLRKFIERLYCCPGCAEVLGPASRAPFLSSHLSQHPKTERAPETISPPVWDPLYNSPSSAYTPQVTKYSLPPWAALTVRRSFLLLSPNPSFFQHCHPSF